MKATAILSFAYACALALVFACIGVNGVYGVTRHDAMVEVAAGRDGIRGVVGCRITDEPPR